ncbi:GFA family protein [Agrobacterium sp. a22-2]|uniref:GFA family protein n=1 Tax=Agrobacterium sp. a22-2 TaxID=2283840 RepID=UPI0014456FE4|nr:GFA family protein [Agrobacterium sp. a22-2]NKN36593.1 GFA family protein [Agrobacterium sp. a22-2]
MQENHNGSCLCGAVRFTILGPLGKVSFCHCSQCRKQTGLYYASTDVANDHVEVTGADNITWYRSSDSAERGFCCVCGSALFWRGDGADQVSILAGAFDQPTELVVGSHIYCADKADFYEIVDNLPRFEAGRSSTSSPGAAG